MTPSTIAVASALELSVGERATLRLEKFGEFISISHCIPVPALARLDTERFSKAGLRDPTQNVRQFLIVGAHPGDVESARLISLPYASGLQEQQSRVLQPRRALPSSQIVSVNFALQ
jgi:hypothetical protein